MFKRLEKWLMGLFRVELTRTEQRFQQDMAALRAELAQAIGVIHTRIEEVKAHTENVATDLHKNITSHAKEVASEIHEKITADARYIAKFQQTARLGCSFCGQLTRTYLIDLAGKIKCADCQKKGVE